MRKAWISILSCFMCFMVSQFSLAATGAFFNITSSSGVSNSININVNTTVPNHTYPNAGIKITSSGFNVTSGCTPNSNGYCLFSVSDSAPKTLTIVGPSSKKLDITLCLNGKGPLTCQEYTIGELFAYVINSGLDSVTVCNVNANTGQFSNCQDAGGSGFNNLTYGALNLSGTRAYLPNTGSNDVSQCTINPATKLFTSCTNSAAFSGGAVLGVGLDPANAFIYFSFLGGAIPQSCSISPGTGLFTACKNAVTDGSVSFGQCTGITINSINTVGYIVSSGSIIYCSVNAGGILSGCTAVGIPNSGSPQGITLNEANTFAYLYGANGTISTCGLSVSGQLSTSCNTAEHLAQANGQPGKLTLGFAEKLAYLPNPATGTVSVCNVNAKTGLLSGCVGTGVGAIFNVPTQVMLTR